MSTDLLWLLMKDNNSYLVKRAGIEFSRDPLSLNNRNTFNGLGVIKENAIGISPSANGKSIKATFTVGKKVHNPSKYRLTKTFKGSNSNHTTHGIEKIVKNQVKVPSVLKAAVARSQAIHRSQVPVKARKASKTQA